MTVSTEVSGPCVFVVDSGPPVHRRPIWPGRYVAIETWADTDISGEDDTVQQACIATWTPEVVAAYQALVPWVESEIVEPVSHLNNGGLARFTGAAPATILEAIRIAGVTRIAKGRWRITLEDAMPSDQYSAMPSVFDALPRLIRVTARTAAYVEVRVTDLAGAAQDASEITVKTERVVSP